MSKPEIERAGATSAGDGNGRSAPPGAHMTRLRDWLDTRTGYRTLVRGALEAPAPRRASWRYITGSALTAMIAVEIITGLFLMFVYSPASTTAWGSVYYINEVMVGGWFLRGVHQFAAQAIVVLLGVHMLRSVVWGAYRAPRELNWWLGLALLFLTLALCLTGNPLPWDQEGYWAWHVETGIAGSTPVLGPMIKRVVLGGTDLGNLTLTRLYGLHVGVLPPLLIGCLLAHFALFRRHGAALPSLADLRDDREGRRQRFYNVVGGTLAFAVVVGLTLVLKGSRLEAPADPAGEYPARPEWYFLPLFKLRTYFPTNEIVATMVIPSAILFVLAALPVLDRVFPKRLSHFFACGFVFALGGSAIYLTTISLRGDAASPKYREQTRDAERARDRAILLARDGIPPEGASALLQRDPQTRGRHVFEAKCSGCHAFGSHDEKSRQAKLRGADLAAFGTRAWVRGLLENPDDPKYLVKVPTRKGRLDGMNEWKEGSSYEPKELDELADFVAKLAATPADMPPEDWAADKSIKSHPAYQAFVEDCLSCHTFGGIGPKEKNRDAPSLYGYGSPTWIARMIRRPESKTLYGFLGKGSQMPAFGDQLTEADMTALRGYLRGDDPAVSMTETAGR